MRYSITLLSGLVLAACGGTLVAETAGTGGAGGGQVDAGGDGAEDADAREIPDALPTKEASTP